MPALPPQLTLLLDAAITNVQHGDPDVHPTLQMRKAIYEAFGERHDARAWQGILAARRVLPIFQRAFPDELLPEQMLNAAECFLQGTISQDEAHAIWDDGYHVGSYWLSDEFAGTNADLVSSAAFCALSGVWGAYFLEDVKIQHRQRVVTETGTIKYKYWIIPSDEWTNKLIFESSCADTVLYAAGAVARSPQTGRRDTEKFRSFWLWWLQEAIPAAWEQVP